MRQRIIQLYGLHGCRFRVLPNLLRRLVPGVAHEIVSISKASIGLSVIGILRHGLIEVLDCFFEPTFGPLVPVIKTLKIELIGLGVFGFVLSYLASLLTG